MVRSQDKGADCKTLLTLLMMHCAAILLVFVAFATNGVLSNDPEEHYNAVSRLQGK